MNLFKQYGDGASAAAKAVLAYLNHADGLECSWDGKRYEAEPFVRRWSNCREQGYVVSLRSKHSTRQINIAFYEHRNSDNICAIVFEKETDYGNPPTIADLTEDQWEPEHIVDFNGAYSMATWITKRLETFWRESMSIKLAAPALRSIIAPMVGS